MVELRRREVKYQVPAWLVPRLAEELGAVLPRDRHGTERGYGVRTLYFENMDLYATREKLAGLDGRAKLRVRTYRPLGPSQPLVLEIKRRAGDRVGKERAALALDELHLLQTGRVGALLAARGQDPVVRRFVAEKQRRGANRTIVVDYQRQAWVQPGPGLYLRATLDTQLRAVTGDGLLDVRSAGLAVLPGVAILEVKTSGPPPTWLPRLARKFHLTPQPVSKLALATLRAFAADG